MAHWSRFSAHWVGSGSFEGMRCFIGLAVVAHRWRCGGPLVNMW